MCVNCIIWQWFCFPIQIRVRSILEIQVCESAEGTIYPLVPNRHTQGPLLQFLKKGYKEDVLMIFSRMIKHRATRSVQINFLIKNFFPKSTTFLQYLIEDQFVQTSLDLRNPIFPFLNRIIFDLRKIYLLVICPITRSQDQTRTSSWIKPPNNLFSPIF